MSITKKIGFSFLICFLFTLAVFTSGEHVAKASSVPKYNFKFKINNVVVNDGSEYELKNEQAQLFINFDGANTPKNMDVSWSYTKPKDPGKTGVIEIVTEGFAADHSEVQLNRTGPGYTTITAKITADGNVYNISMNLKVQLYVDTAGTGMVSESNTNTAVDSKILRLESTIDENGENKAVIDPSVSTKEIKLKYIDYETGGTTATGSSIEIDPDTFEFVSSNEGVAKVDKKGLITAQGSGYSEITVTFNGTDKPMIAKMRVVVKPTFSMVFVDNDGVSQTYASQDKITSTTPLRGNVPRSFTLNSNAFFADYLAWEVYDITSDSSTPMENKDKVKLPTNSDKLQYKISPYSGNVFFDNVKAGIYEIFAYTKSDLDYRTNAPYAYMRIAVPIVMDHTEFYMQKNDSFNILDISNIPRANSFSYNIKNEYLNYVQFDGSTGEVTALKSGYAEIVCTPTKELADAFGITSPYVIKIHIIDGISLNMTNATMAVSSTLILVPNVSSNAAVTWKSSDEKIATVEGGKVTAKKVGEVDITASQVIDGAVRKATCKIKVVDAVSKIEISPNTALLNKGEYLTLRANITPKNLTNVTLHWTSSNESIVKVLETVGLSSNIQAGQTSGIAVISAINQDNIVVGYCYVTVKQKVTKITLSETNVAVPQSVGQLQLRASVYPDNASDKTVIWTSSDTAKATVDANGLVSFKKTGTVTITATAKDDTNVTAICNINILAPVASINLDEKTKLMYAGQTARLSYVMQPANASTADVTWTSSNPSVASVDGTGLVSARSVGTTVIVVRTVDGGYTSFCTITVQRIATGIKLDKNTLELKVGESYEFKPALIPADSTNTTITWESTDTKIATVDSKGKVTAKSNGSVLIIAKIPSGTSVYCRVTVEQAVSGLILNYKEKTIYIGGDFELKVSVTPTSASEPDVTWTSSNTAVATVSTTGIVTGISGGTAIITCTTVDGGFSATCIVKVREGEPTVTINYEDYILGINKSVTLIATVSDGVDNSTDVFWMSSDTDIATVNQQGKVTGKKLGRVTITALAKDGSESEANCEIRVVTPATGITVNNPAMNLLIGQSKQLKATVKESNATIKTVNWSSSDPDVASVDEDGNVFGIAEGDAIITAETMDNSGKKAISYVSVNKRVASSGVTLQDKQVVLMPGEEKIVGLALTPANSTDGVAWSTDNAAVAKIDKNSGKITARATGVAYVTVMTDSGKTATVEVIVIGLNYTELTLEQYTTYPYKLEVEGATTNVSWSIDNPQVAIISNGVVSSRGVGTATITAQVNGRRLTCKLKVVKIK